MTARISRDFEFVSGIYIENELYMTPYDVELNFLVESESIYEQNIALDRIKYFFIECLDSTIFINDADSEGIDKFVSADMRVIPLPEEPYDQIISIMILTKINAITEGRLVATDIKVTSRLSDGVSYYHCMEESIGPFQNKGWWDDSAPSTTTRLYKPKNKKVFKINKTISTWDELELGWDKDKPKKATSPDVVFVEFEHKTDK